MRTSALVMTAAAAVLLASPATPQDGANKGRAEASARKVKELRKERIDTLTELVDQATARFQRAQGSYEEVLEAQVQLLRARLDAAEKESDRVALYEQAVGLLSQLEKVARARVEAGRGTNTAVLSIKARRLEVEIQLEQAKAKG